MDLTICGKRALVCGSSKGIGKAVAIQLANLGASVTLFARNKQKLDNVLLELKTGKEQRHTILTADFENPDEVHSVYQDFINQNNTINILINNTGGPAPSLIKDAKSEDFLRAFQTHLINNHNLVKLSLDGMKSSGFGRVINIISTSVKEPIAGLGVSNTIRGAVASWSKTLAGELGQFGITVNNILPGKTETERLHKINENKANKMGISLEDVVQLEYSQIPLKRFASPEEIANAVAFLASPASSYINGINLPVDGGKTGSL